MLRGSTLRAHLGNCRTWAPRTPAPYDSTGSSVVTLLTRTRDDEIVVSPFNGQQHRRREDTGGEKRRGLQIGAWCKEEESENVFLPVSLDRVRLAEWCRRWKVRALAVFGSALRQDFGPTSDVDLLVTFEPDAAWSLIDHARMEQELTDIIGRKVDLVSRAGLERSANWIRRQAILETARPLDVQG